MRSRRPLSRAPDERKIGVVFLLAYLRSGLIWFFLGYCLFLFLLAFSVGLQMKPRLTRLVVFLRIVPRRVTRVVVRYRPLLLLLGFVLVVDTRWCRRFLLRLPLFSM